jgi:cytochrome c oxidase assembly factor CtaG
VPLLLVTALGNRLPTKGSGHSLTWTAAVIIAVALNSALLIAVHLPGVRGHAAHLGIVPMWLPAVVVTIGLGYWAAVVLSAGRLPSSVRRAGLIVGQEVAAILGLAALLRPDSHMHGHTAFGLPASMDQRLGGLLMLAACAAVTLPLANRLTQQQAIRQTRMERHVN